MHQVLENKGLYCTGCGACANACPVDAISMSEDLLGFAQAKINTGKCIHCNKCEMICPVMNTKQNDNAIMPPCYAAMANDNVRYSSSSGGAFSVFASHVLENNGVVVGAALSESSLSIQHILIDTKEDLYRLQKSKYVQSDIGMIYRSVEDKLINGYPVLFSGCPCQVAGLNAFLGKDHERLYTIDIFCHGVPSQKMFRESITEFSKEQPVIGVDFRDKDYGWECLAMTLNYSDGSKRRLSYDESRYEQGFHPGMTMRDSCYDCKFCEFPRRGDISIGDFWNIHLFETALDDRKGTSALLINSQKGLDLFNKVRKDFPICREVPIRYLEHNRIHRLTEKDAGRNHFLALYPKRDFNTAVLYAQQRKFDIGIVGNWSYPNYGTELTYYALYRYLKNQGNDVAMISWPWSSKWTPYETPQLFERNPYADYEIAPIPQTREDMQQFNEKCNTFILGSDQLLNNNLYNWFDKFMQMDWVWSNKQKIAYSTSFGCDYIWGSDEDRAELSLFLKKFDSISVREHSAVELMNKYYGVSADLVLDPVFLIDCCEYETLAAGNSYDLREKRYLYSYILDTSKEKADILKRAAEQIQLEVVATLDGSQDALTSKKTWDIPTECGVSVERWLAYIQNCSFMITDSFHGMCFAILFKKPFIAISNSARGKTRFDTILSHLGLEERLVNSEIELQEKLYLFSTPTDYAAAFERLEPWIQKSQRWLNSALSTKKSNVSMSDYDILSRRLADIAKKLNIIDSDEKKHWEQLEDHRLRLDGVDDLICQHQTRMNTSEETNQRQWEILEDYRLRLDGVDDLICQHQTRMNASEETNQRQWEILEDYRLRLDGVDDRISQQQTRLNASEETNQRQWEILEDHRLRLDSVDDLMRRLANKTDTHSSLIDEISKILCNLENEKNNYRAMLEEELIYIAALENLSSTMEQRLTALESSRSFKIGRFITWIPRKIKKLFKK